MNIPARQIALLENAVIAAADQALKVGFLQAEPHDVPHHRHHQLPRERGCASYEHPHRGVKSALQFLRCTFLFAMILIARPWQPALAAERAWRGDFVARLEALALLQSLNAELLSHDSATLTLDRWCGAHQLAYPAKIVAELVGDDKRPSDEERRNLDVSSSEIIRYRHVRLRCGNHVLSEADNWYVPARLTVEMNHQLDTTDISFGRAVQDLHFRRRTLSARLLWSPLPEGWEDTSASLPSGSPLLTPPSRLIEHRAILTRVDGVPFSEVVENYTDEVLAFPEPPRR